MKNWKIGKLEKLDQEMEAEQTFKYLAIKILFWGGLLAAGLFVAELYFFTVATIDEAGPRFAVMDYMLKNPVQLTEQGL